MDVDPEKKKYAIRANVREGDEFTEIRLSTDSVSQNTKKGFEDFGRLFKSGFRIVL